MSRLFRPRDLDAVVAAVLAGEDERVERAMAELAESRCSPAPPAEVVVPSAA